MDGQYIRVRDGSEYGTLGRVDGPQLVPIQKRMSTLDVPLTRTVHHKM